jgi:tetratricopeptide (TPR) repeat protein
VLPLVLAVFIAPALGQAQSNRSRASSPPAPPAPGKSASPPRAPGKGNEFQTYLNAAVRLYESLEYEQALERLSRARRYVREVEDDVIISLYEGIIHADMGRKEQSQAAFRDGLLLQPDAKLPVKVSPKVERDFEAVRQDVRRELDALHAKQQAEQPRPDPTKPEPPPLDLTPLAPTPTPGVSTVAPAPYSRALPLSLMGGGALLAGAGVYLGMTALSFNERKFQLTANEAIQERASASTKLTVGTLMVGGGMAALGAGVVFLVLPQPAPAQASTVRANPPMITPVPGGFALSTTGHF